MGSCAAPSAKGDDKFITTDYLQQCRKLKRIIGATLGFKSMKTAYATIKGIEVMRALRKGQASAFYYGDPLGEMRLVSRVFEM
ncbi:hypothetical protein BK270_26890 [Escherichia coli]|nr:hypothetical protein BK270_26890 [Escherichia coli]